jgi:hypothetical protein
VGEPLRCAHCARSFVDAERRLAHTALRHPETVDAETIAAYRTLYRREQQQLRRLRLELIGGVVAVYFAVFVLYTVVG